MQLISCYLYSNKIDVYTNAAAAWKTERYRRVYNRNIKVYRGVDNRIDLQVRNSDEKAADVTGSTLVFNLVEREHQSLVAQKDCVTVDASKGKYYVILTESEMLDIEEGYFQYSIYNEIRTDNGNGTHAVSSRTPLYIDSQYGTLNTIEVLGNGSGDIQAPTTIKEFSKHIIYNAVVDSFYYVSGIISANPQTSTPQSLHTFQFYFNNYTGDVVLQGSLSDGGNPGIWVDVTTVDPEVDQYKNVVGKYNWFRIKHTPDNTNVGTVDKILYR